jgi:uncharacterized damage-inducible protein DinB
MMTAGTQHRELLRLNENLGCGDSPDMDALQQIFRLWKHRVWADDKLFDAVRPWRDLAAAWREYAHILAAEEVWLARLEGRTAAVAVWPVLSIDETIALREQVAAGYATFLDGLTPESISATVSYVNSAGDSFESAIEDILFQVLLHGQYHRGKVNLLLRQAGHSPAPVDYISFVRGAPAAVTPVDAPDAGSAGGRQG